MFKGLRGKFSLDMLIRFSADDIEVYELGGSKYLREKAVLAVQAPQNKGEFNQVTAIGEQALVEDGKPGVSLHYAFDHPRICIADFQIAEKLVQTLIRKFHDDTWFAPSPRLVLQPQHNTEGGLTDVEHKMLVELGHSAGAREVVIAEDLLPSLHLEPYSALANKYGAAKSQ